MEQFRKKLFEGEDIEFSNEQWCNQVESDDIRDGFVRFNKKWELFIIFFNGAVIGSFRTLHRCQLRLEKLMKKWNCEFNS